MTIANGSRLGPYEILAPIGAGGMGEVWRARDPRLGRDVAIKVLPASFSADPGRLRRFEQEARAAGILNHPNITAVFDIGEHDGAPYVVQELLEGETLHSALARGRISSRRAIDYALQIAHGLAAAHEKRIVHRDLKPENLFVTRDGRVKILDFGLAKLTHQEEGSGATSLTTAAAGTEPGVVLGTLGYMSPEQVRGRQADPRSDIFSFGAILYEMLAGRRAFRGESAADTMSAILREDPPDLSATNRDISPGLERIVHHCLEKDPERRFHSAHDLAFDLESLSTPSDSRATRSSVGPPEGWAFRRTLLALAISGAAGAAFFVGTRASFRSRESKPETFRRVTFRRGNILSARFVPDGQTVVYSAAWEGNPSELFTLRTDDTGSRPLGIRNAEILGVSSKGELAVLQTNQRTLARIPLGGGSPRDVMENVEGADWSPDGEALAVLRRIPAVRRRLEYPIGRVLAEGTSVGSPRIAPDGQLVAFVEHIDFRNQGIAVVDHSGKKRELSTGWDGVRGLAWSSKGDELFFVAGKTEDDVSLRAVDLSSHERVLLPGASGAFLHDVARDGKILLERSSAHRGILFGSADQERETQLAWLDGSYPYDLSADGRQIVFGEGGEGGSAKGDAYLRRTDGSPPVRLGDGSPTSLSPDGKWALTKTRGSSPDLVLLPTGPGTPKKIPLRGITRFGARFSPDGRILVFHATTGKDFGLFVMGVDGGTGRSVDVAGLDLSHVFAVSPDGELLAYGTTDHKVRIVPIDGGSSRDVPHAGLEPHDKLTQWSSDKRSLYVYREGEIPARVWRLDVETGEKVLWKELKPSDAAGVTQIDAVSITPDGRSYAYGYAVVDTSTLYVVSGLK